MSEAGTSSVASPPLASEPRRSRHRIAAIGEIVLCSSVPTQLLMGRLLTALGWPAIEPDGHLSLKFVLALSLADTALLVTLMVLLTRARGERVAALWLGDRPVGWEVLRGVALVPPAFFIAAALLVLLRIVAPGLHNVTTNPLEALATGGAFEALMLGVVAIIAGGVREELQRAFLLRRFEQHLGGSAVGVVALSLAFGLGHAIQGWDASIATAALGAFWALVYLRRGSSIAPIVSHAGFNSMEVLRVALGGS